MRNIIFSERDLDHLYQRPSNSSGEENGQVTIIGGSSLFHGAPLLSLTAAAKVVDMVFFASPEPTLKDVADLIKSKLFSFVWVPWDEVTEYIEKSDAVLIGPGFMRFRSEKIPEHRRNAICDEECKKTTKITKDLLEKYPNKKWVIDAGSLQVMDASWIPANAILTPNKKEFEYIFSSNIDPLNEEKSAEIVTKMARKYHCTIIVKAPTSIASDGVTTYIIKGGNAGLTKGGTGDVQAGLTTALYAKNSAVLSASGASYIIKKTAENLEKRVGMHYSADDLAQMIFRK